MQHKKSQNVWKIYYLLRTTILNWLPSPQKLFRTEKNNVDWLYFQHCKEWQKCKQNSIPKILLYKLEMKYSLPSYMNLLLRYVWYFCTQKFLNMKQKYYSAGIEKNRKERIACPKNCWLDNVAPTISGRG